MLLFFNLFIVLFLIGPNCHTWRIFMFFVYLNQIAFCHGLLSSWSLFAHNICYRGGSSTPGSLVKSKPAHFLQSTLTFSHKSHSFVLIDAWAWKFLHCLLCHAIPDLAQCSMELWCCCCTINEAPFWKKQNPFCVFSCFTWPSKLFSFYWVTKHGQTYNKHLFLVSCLSVDVNLECFQYTARRN